MSNDALWCVSSHDDGWLMHMDVFKPCIMACDNRHFLKNSFSNATIDIPCRFDRPINAFVVDNRYSTWPERFTLHKIIVCSPDLIVAASRLIDNNIVSFRPGIDTSWSVLPYDDDDGDHKRMYEDIALYRGKLYALTSNGDLLVHEIRDNNTLSRAELVIRGAAAELPLSHLQWQYSIDDIVHQYRVISCKYLVISCSGTLLMFRCTISPMLGTSANVDDYEIKFKVFEADLEGGQWLEVKSLDGQVVFLSKACSKAILSFDHGDPRFGGNCIFFLGGDLTRQWGDIHTRITNSYVYQQKEGIPMYGVYDFRTSKISLSTLGQHRFSSMVQWFFPRM
uniref:KIB1-4 beta-propeller domain-containing protein n=1 Tax=Oryza nivara TaxID=4536 RepID=A0A0E0J6Y0_ORYNI